MKNKRKSPKLVLIVSFRILNWLYFLIIPILRKKFKTKFIFICGQNLKSKFEKILTVDDKIYLYEDISERYNLGYQKEIKLEEKIARKNEKKYAFSYMRDVIQQDRELSAGFLSYAPRFIWNEKKISYNDLVKVVNGYIKFTEDLLKKYKVDLALVWPVDALNACIANVLEKKKIKVTYPYNAKFKSYAYWANNAFQDSNKLKSIFKKTKFKEIIDDSSIVPPQTGWPDTRSMNKLFSFSSLLKNILRLISHRLEFFILDIIRFDFKKKNRISIKHSLLFQFNKYYLYKVLGKISERDLRKFEDKPFLFYALPLEPEFSVQGRSKEFNDQKAIIKLISLNLPAGYNLVIKEHSDIGRRSKDFYTELLKLPNVVMAHPSIRGIDLVRKSRAVASMCGTVSLEATLLGKRAIEFSLHSSFSFLKNIYVISNYSNLNNILSEVMEILDAKSKNLIKKDGAMLIESIKSISFEAADTPLFYGDKETIAKLNIEKALKLLLEEYNHD